MNPIQHLSHRLASEIPLCKAMQVRVQDYDGESLTLTAPLAPNINDKGTAFGGSLNNVMTLAGWGLVYLALWQQNLLAEVVIHESQMQFLAPVTGPILGQARFTDSSHVQRFSERVAAGKRAGISIDGNVYQKDAIAAQMGARFVAWLKP